MSCPAPEVTAESLTDEMIEELMVAAGNAGDHDTLEYCRRAAEGCASKVLFGHAVSYVVDAINARRAK